LVLVADDDDLIRRTLERSLIRLGCDVVLAEDGDQTLKTAVELEPAVTFLDLKMPGLDGHALLRRLPAAGVRSSVVVMSGEGSIDDVIDALRMGAVDYLKKPWESCELASALERAVEVFRAVNAHAARLTFTSRRPAPAPPPSPPPSPREVLSPTLGAEQLLERLRAGALPMPEIPAALQHLRRLVRRPRQATSETSVGELADLIERERPLTLILLRLANSARGAQGLRVEGVHSAVARLGLSRVHLLAETATLRAAFPLPVDATARRKLQRRIWRFSVARGLAMRAIAEVTPSAPELDADRFYLAGLLSDVGAMFLLWTCPDGPLAAPAVGAPACEQMARWHGEFAGELLGRWEMGDDLARLAREHHADAPSVPDSPLWCAAALAARLAERLVSFSDPTGAERLDLEQLERCAYVLGIGDTVLRKIAAALVDEARHLWAIHE
jgi:CheY-like chemotaxis protein/HD-like signal output (HDOD) protein